MIELHDRPEDPMAFPADVPAPAVRDFHDLPAHVQALRKRLEIPRPLRRRERSGPVSAVGPDVGAIAPADVLL